MSASRGTGRPGTKPSTGAGSTGTSPVSAGRERGAVARNITRSGVLLLLAAMPALGQPSRPNILWITSEDSGPHLGAYGDPIASTPALDRLARRGTRFTHVWSTAPVCAPARTAIISGLYPTSTGSEHMRSLTRLPDGMRLFPALLREAGYYASNNEKEDYNLVKGPGVWDDSSRTAHWRGRKPGQPFFAVFNIHDTHESALHRKPAPRLHDPSKLRVPAYHPDTPEVRADWAAYYDNLAVMDGKVAERLAELEADRLVEDTIVFYYADNGAPLPRSKRVACNSGLHVPMIVHVPKRFRSLAPEGYAEGAASARLVGFVDLAPTALSLAGVQPPEWMQGRAFMGRFATRAPEHLFGFRGRMDERYDMVRAVRDGRHVYIRNFMPHRPAGQHVQFMFRMPTTVAWKRLFDAGALSATQAAFWRPKPSEELYDLQEDPDEVRNLAEEPAHAATRERLRRALEDHLRDVRDVGFLPEYALQREPVPYVFGHDVNRYDFDTVFAMASRASDRSVDATAIRPGLASPDPLVRYWAATGFLVRGPEAVREAEKDLLRVLDSDAEPGPRVVAGEALARFGGAEAQARAIPRLLGVAEAGEGYAGLLAVNALGNVPDLPRDARERLARLPRPADSSELRRAESYLLRVVDATLEGLR